MVDRVEPGGATNAAYQRLRRLRFASRTSTDWNWRNGADWCCRSRHTRGPSSLYARCDAALFRIRFGRVANDEVHDGQAGTVESGMPRRDGAQGLPPRLSALRILHAWSLPLLRRGNYRRPPMRRVADCRLAQETDGAQRGCLIALRSRFTATAPAARRSGSCSACAEHFPRRGSDHDRPS